MYLLDGLSVNPHKLPTDAIPLLHVFAQRLRNGSLTARGLPARSRTVEDAVHAVGQAYSSMGPRDPRLNNHGSPDFRLTSLYQAWSKADDSPSRVKPLPTTLMRQTMALSRVEVSPEALAVADLLPLSFFFLLHPGEFTGTPMHASDDLFRLQDEQLWIGTRSLDHSTCPIPDWRRSRRPRAFRRSRHLPSPLHRLERPCLARHSPITHYSA